MTSNLYHKRKVDTVFGFDFFSNLRRVDGRGQKNSI